MKVAVLHSEVSQNASADELDTLIQAHAVLEALRQMRHESAILPFSICLRETIRALKAIRPDCVFNLVETVQGRGRLIHMAPAVLDHIRIPYTGSSTESIFLTSNKLIAKKLMRASGLQTPPWLSLQEMETDLSSTFPECIIKSVWEHASVGLDESSVVPSGNRTFVLEFMQERSKVLQTDCFAEAYVEGREFNVSLLAGDKGPEILPIAEIQFSAFPPRKPRVLGYRAKWEPESFEYINTTRCFAFCCKDRGLSSLLAERARECWSLFGLKGYARIDFRVDAGGVPWIIDINANPCLSPDAGFYAASREAGLDFHQVISRIIDNRNAFF